MADSSEDLKAKVLTHIGGQLDVSQLSDEEIIKNLPDDVLMSHITEKSNQPVNQSPYDSPYMRGLFQGGGQAIGGMAGTALGSAAGGVGAIPGGFGGAIMGGMTGEALRQFFAKTSGGGPQSYGRQYLDLSNAGAGAAVAEAIPPAIGSIFKPVGKFVGPIFRSTYRNIKEPLLDWVKMQYNAGNDILNYAKYPIEENIFPMIQRMGAAVKKVTTNPESIVPPPKASLYPVAEKAANALEAVRGIISEKYGAAAEKALETPARTSLYKAANSMKNELRQAGLINNRGTPQPFGSREFTSEERLLLDVYRDLSGISPNPVEGMPEAVQPGTFINFDRARRLLSRIDEAIGATRTRNTQRILISSRNAIMEGLKKSDDNLAKAVPEYADFVGIRDTLENALSNPDKAVGALLSGLKDTKRSLRTTIQKLDSLAPDDFKFYQDLLDYENKSVQAELAKKAPKTISSIIRNLKNPNDYERVIKGIFEQPETVLAELEALDSVADEPFMTQIKDYAARQAFKSTMPTRGGVAAALSVPRNQATIIPKVLAFKSAMQTAQGMAPIIPPSLRFILSQGEQVNQ